jgi:predicted kinase
MSRLIIICGLPGSGKTMLAESLSKHLKRPLLAKDAIKEQLYDELELRTLEDSKKIGKVSMDLLYNMAEKHAEKGLDLIMEAPFTFPEDYPIFQNLIESMKSDFMRLFARSQKISVKKDSTAGQGMLRIMT